MLQRVTTHCYLASILTCDAFNAVSHLTVQLHPLVGGEGELTARLGANVVVADVGVEVVVVLHSS